MHSCMTPHGPDTVSYEAGIQRQNEQPAHLPRDTLAFMFEFPFLPRVTPAAMSASNFDRNYYQCWTGLKSHFDPSWKPEGAAGTADGTVSNGAARPPPADAV